MTSTRREHWERVYRDKSPDRVSWYQDRPETSLALIEAAGIDRSSGIIDVGGGASSLVDCLLECGYSPLTVLDLSARALQYSQQRLGPAASAVQWIVEDVELFRPPVSYGLWHDRAVFHFLIDPVQRRAYVETLRQALSPGGTAILATFALDGPEKCSGLPVQRHDEATLQRELGSDFVLRESRRVVHCTPSKSSQAFLYTRFRFQPGGESAEEIA